MKTRITVYLCVILGLILSLQLIPNSNQRGTTNMSAKAAPAQASTPVSPPPTLDDLFAEVARRVPAFGGMYIGTNRALHVYLLDPAERAAAEAAIIEVFGRARVPEGSIEVE